MLGKNTYFYPLSDFELINRIRLKTDKFNLDNISRTHAYLTYYEKHKEICWSFLASQVSRNAGWSMCDLQDNWIPKILNMQQRKQLFLTYEKANWLIFKDAYPQLLLYEYSTKINAPMFHLLKFFHVSNFMEEEWGVFWKYRDKKRLMNSLIINEQHIIEKPVIQNESIKNKVFQSIPYIFQDLLHFNSVIFPTLKGELYGASVSRFTSVDHRINLGNNLASILFEPNLYQELYLFARKVTHTGSRRDYQRFMKDNNDSVSPFLRTVYPIINHSSIVNEEWYHGKIKKKWRKKKEKNEPIHLTAWYLNKQQQLHQLIHINQTLLHKR